jgi:hypothetical protein
MNDLKKELREMEYDLKFIQQVSCTKDEEISFSNDGLPDGVMERSDGTHYRIVECLTDEERQKYSMYKQTLYLRTISGIMIFFTVMTVIGGIFLIVK